MDSKFQHDQRCRYHASQRPRVGFRFPTVHGGYVLRYYASRNAPPPALAREMVLFTISVRLAHVDRFACQHPMNLKCTNCDNSVICKHRRWFTQCVVCCDLISERNENVKSRVGPRLFKHGNRCSCEPGRLLEHGKRRSHCKECGRGSICEHGRERSKCKECGGASICEHGRHRSACKECGGASICEHGKQRLRCKYGVGCSSCVYRRQCTDCKECRGGSSCKHRSMGVNTTYARIAKTVLRDTARCK